MIKHYCYCSGTGSGPKVNNKDAKGKTVVKKGHEVSASTSDSNNNVIINILTDMRNEQSDTNKRLEDMSKRIDVLYNDDGYDEEYGCESENDEDVDEVHEADDGHDTGTNEPPFDDAVRLIVLLGRNCNLAKCDIDSAYRNILVNYLDYELLGIELDSVLMEARLPDDKFRKIEAALQAVKVRKRVTLRELQSLIGLLNFACCVVVPGRAFLRRLIDLTKGISRPHHYIRLTKESRLDLLAWYMFINCCNGKALMLDHVWMSSVKLHLYTDAAGAIGYGAIFKSHWFYGRRSDSLNECTITFKELFPIVLAVEVWGHLFKNSCLLFHSDNQAVIQEFHRLAPLMDKYPTDVDTGLLEVC
ncbi:unnamed protein product [Mytilus coruscus]|uniref:Reverse transcriptase RNase H-like domain-containing protein n=1 Tax=Mytilus coruscus TaxID=42192 RepID=A0A6J8A438_MYTCO|nr:unnamed protein product [Mytilus coruscus]